MEPYWEVAVTVAPQSLTLLTLLKGHTLHTHHPNGTLMELNEPRRDALAFLRVSYESHESHWSPIGCPIGCPVRDGWSLSPVTVAPQSRPLHDCRPSAMLSHPVTVAPSVTPSTHFTHSHSLSRSSQP